MLRIDYIGSAFVWLIIFSLFGLAISNVSTLDLSLFVKIVGGIIITSLFMGLLAKFLQKD